MGNLLALILVPVELFIRYFGEEQFTATKTKIFQQRNAPVEVGEFLLFFWFDYLKVLICSNIPIDNNIYCWSANSWKHAVPLLYGSAILIWTSSSIYYLSFHSLLCKLQESVEFDNIRIKDLPAVYSFYLISFFKRFTTVCDFILFIANHYFFLKK